HRLIEIRHQAFTLRQEELKEFVLLGRYWLTRTGGCGIAIDGVDYQVPKDVAPSIPDVLETSDFSAFMSSNGFPALHTAWALTHDVTVIAPADIACAGCGHSWELH